MIRRRSLHSNAHRLSPPPFSIPHSATDSGCYFLRMLYFYWRQSPNSNAPNGVLELQSVQNAVSILLEVWTAEQQHEYNHIALGPLLDCTNCRTAYRSSTLPRSGKGSPTNATAGLTWSGFRPSDEPCQYGYHIPDNMFAVVVLGYVVELASEVWNDRHMARKAAQLASHIDQGIRDHAVVTHPQFGSIYAYEVDGLGNYNLMDDPNVPSLLSIPYLGYAYDPDVYANTRRFILSPSNPNYRKGTNPVTGEIEGYGSPHTANIIPDNIWPMALAMQALTSSHQHEKLTLVEQLVQASVNTGWMHESFSVQNPAVYTREGFCWADSLFAELVLSMTDECPQRDRKYQVLEWRDPVMVAGGPYSMD